MGAKRWTLCAGVALGLAGSLASAQAADPVGTWLTRDGSYRFRVVRCGAALCVTMAWSEHEEIDSNNPDPVKRGRRLVGATLVADGRADGPNRWSGNIYNWTDGKTYYGYVEPIDGRTMKATGCMMGRAACIVSTKLYRVN